MADPWILTYEGYDAENEGTREALCTLGNGLFATRAAAEEMPAGHVHYPGTYVGGGYNRLASEVAGRTVVNEDLVNFPNWLPLNFRPRGGDWVDFSKMEILYYRQHLNLRDGILLRRYRIRDGEGRETSVACRRLVHMGKPHYAAIDYCITPENWSGTIQIRSGIDGSVKNEGVARYRQLNSKHLRVIEKGKVSPDGIYLVAQTNQSRVEVSQATRTLLYVDDQPHPASLNIVDTEESIFEDFECSAVENQTITVEKTMALYTSRDRGITESGLDARLAINRCPRFAELVRTHRLAWRILWNRCDIDLFSEEQRQSEYPDEQLNLRLHIFHLLATVSTNSLGQDVSVPARGLHGEAYRGHIFWDELFIFPFYTLRLPEITRSLMLYRYHRLDMARAMAKEAGYEGAMYPWQSSSNGREETQEIHLNPRSGRWDPDHSRLQRHINVAIAFNIWNYYKITGDKYHLSRYGAEMLVEIARLWASISVYNESKQRYEICRDMGPDEYHEKYPDDPEGGINNNAYTNIMVVWTLQRTLESLEQLRPERREELCMQLELQPDEWNRWEDMTRRMFIPFHGDRIISQFEGYDKLDEFDWQGYREKYGDIERLDRILKAEDDSPDHYKVSKQADVIMLFYLLTPEELEQIFDRLGYTFDPQLIERNLYYYMERTSHGSTLSKVVYASVLDRLDRTRGWELFREALRADLDDVQGGTTREGIHLGAMSGTVDIVLRHYAGIDTSGDTITFNPRLPKDLPGLHFRVQYRGNWIIVDIAQDHFRLEVEPDGRHGIRLLIGDKAHTIEPGGVYECKLPLPTAG